MGHPWPLPTPPLPTALTALLWRGYLLRWTLHVRNVGDSDAPLERRRPEVDWGQGGGGGGGGGVSSVCVWVWGGAQQYLPTMSTSPPQRTHTHEISKAAILLVLGPAGWFQNAANRAEAMAASAGRAARVKAPTRPYAAALVLSKLAESCKGNGVVREIYVRHRLVRVLRCTSSR
jgi:hypothetical protein